MKSHHAHILKSRGFAAISAVFLLVVLAGLGAYMLMFSNTQQSSAAQDVLGTRAYWAARAGLGWGTASASNDCPPSPTRLVVDDMEVQVTCSVRMYIDGADTIRVLQLQSQASNRAPVGGAGYVERSLTASLVLN